jgi:hypothetical protein
MTSTLRACAIGVVASLAIVAVADTPFADQTPVNPDAKILADFNERVKAYVALRNKVDNDAPKLKETKEAAKIQEAQLALAAVIRNARAEAKQGDIFTPEIEKKFRALLSPEVKGPAGAKAKATILEEKPMVELKVNTEYPSAEPLSTVPPTVLQAMPPLPKGEGLEYRFVRKHLILLDTRANLIVDYLLNAIP